MVSAAKLSADDHRRVVEAIGRAETLTLGEIFVVVSSASADYRVFSMVWAGVAALLAGFATAALFPSISAGSLVLGQVLVLAVVAALLSVPGLRMHLAPRALQESRAHARASEQFLAHNLHSTTSRTGVLIFVSLAERHVSVLADTAIHTRVAADFWERVVARLTAGIAAGRLGEAIAEAVEACGTVLAEHFPRRPDDRNELPDRLVEI